MEASREETPRGLGIVFAGAASWVAEEAAGSYSRALLTQAATASQPRSQTSHTQMRARLRTLVGSHSCTEQYPVRKEHKEHLFVLLSGAFAR